jgi:acetyl-CoA carboxylase biotin carboxyl carrier protein
MDIIKTTTDLADILKEKKLSYIRIKDGETEIEVGIDAPVVAPAMPAVSAIAAPAAVQTSAPAEAAESGNFVKSPIIGTFYAAPAPDKPAFVKVGDKVEKGQVVCIVESMKLMNEIACEHSGTVAEIYMSDGEAVEFDQKLMKIT